MKTKMENKKMKIKIDEIYYNFIKEVDKVCNELSLLHPKKFIPKNKDEFWYKDPWTNRVESEIYKDGNATWVCYKTKEDAELAAYIEDTKADIRDYIDQHIY